MKPSEHGEPAAIITPQARSKLNTTRNGMSHKTNVQHLSNVVATLGELQPLMVPLLCYRFQGARRLILEWIPHYITTWHLTWEMAFCFSCLCFHHQGGLVGWRTGGRGNGFCFSFLMPLDFSAQRAHASSLYACSVECCKACYNCRNTLGEGDVVVEIAEIFIYREENV